MKKSILFLSSLLLTFSSAQAGNTEQEQKAVIFYRQALTHEKKGEVNHALTKLRKALVLAPNFIKARQRLSSLSANAATIIYKQRVGALAKVNVEVIELENSTVEEAFKKVLRYVKKHNEKHGTKIVSNLVVHDKKKKLKDVEITFSLKNIPATVVLDEIAKQGRCNYKLEKYMIRVQPN